MEEAAPKREEAKPVRPAPRQEPPAAAASAVREEAPVSAPQKEESKREDRLFAPAASRVEDEAAEPLPEPGFFSQPAGKILIAVVALVLVVGAFFLFRGTRSSPGPQAGPVDASSLALRVERSSGQLMLSWNRNAELIQRAQRATLSISDGDHKEDVDLDLGQLRTGNVVYSPLTNDVSFRLEVTDMKNGKSLSESVRVLAGRPSPAVVANSQTPAPKPELAPEPAAPAQQPAPAAPVEAAAPPPAPAAQVTAVRPRPDSLAARLRPAAQIPEPPTLEGSSMSSSGPAVPIGQTALNAPAPPPAAPAPPQSSSPSPSPQMRSGGNVVPARVIRDSPPVYPSIARQARVSGVVRVQAVVGADGKVKQATAVSGPPLLRQSAVDAVRRRLYEPTKLNGNPIEGQVQVDIAFTM